MEVQLDQRATRPVDSDGGSEPDELVGADPNVFEDRCAASGVALADAAEPPVTRLDRSMLMMPLLSVFDELNNPSRKLWFAAICMVRLTRKRLRPASMPGRALRLR